MPKNSWLKAGLTSKTSINTFIAMFGNFVISILGLLFTIFVARTLSPSNFGLFTVLVTISIIVVGVADLGTASSLTNFLPKSKYYRNQLISLMFWFQIVVSGFLFLVLISTYPFWNRYFPEITLPQAILTGWLSFAFILNGFGQKVMRAQGLFSRVAALQIIDSLVKLLLVALLVNVFQDQSINLILICTFLSAFSSGILGISWGLKKLIVKVDLKIIAALVSFAKWGALIEIFSELLIRLDVVLLSFYSNNYQTGVYAAANRISLVIILVTSTLSSVVAPHFSAIKSITALRRYSLKLLLMIFSLSLAFIPLYFIAEPAVLLIYGSDYQAAIPVFKLIVLSSIPLMFSLITANAITYTLGQPNFVAMTKFLQLLVFLGFSTIMIPRLGALGAAFALLAANTFFLGSTGTKLLLAQRRINRLSNVHRFDSVIKLPTPNFQNNQLIEGIP